MIEQVRESVAERLKTVVSVEKYYQISSLEELPKRKVNNCFTRHTYSALVAPLVPFEKFSMNRTQFFSNGTAVPPL